MLDREPNSFATVTEALEELRLGKMIVLVDADDREAEGDLVLAAQFASQQTINFMVRWGRELICLALTAGRIDALGLSQMAEPNTSVFGTAFITTIEVKEGVTSGISAADRARTSVDRPRVLPQN